jgi:hypothetical protein
MTPEGNEGIGTAPFRIFFAETNFGKDELVKPKGQVSGSKV